MYCEKCEYEFFENFKSCKAWLKITLPKNKFMQNSGDIEACVSVKTHRRENVKFIVTNCKEKFRL